MIISIFHCLKDLQYFHAGYQPHKKPAFYPGNFERLLTKSRLSDSYCFCCGSGLDTSIANLIRSGIRQGSETVAREVSKMDTSIDVILREHRDAIKPIASAMDDPRVAFATEKVFDPEHPAKVLERIVTALNTSFDEPCLPMLWCFSIAQDILREGINTSTDDSVRIEDIEQAADLVERRYLSQMESVAGEFVSHVHDHNLLHPLMVRLHFNLYIEPTWLTDSGRKKLVSILEPCEKICRELGKDILRELELVHLHIDLNLLFGKTERAWAIRNEATPYVDWIVTPTQEVDHLIMLINGLLEGWSAARRMGFGKGTSELHPSENATILAMIAHRSSEQVALSATYQWKSGWQDFIDEVVDISSKIVRRDPGLLVALDDYRWADIDSAMISLRNIWERLTCCLRIVEKADSEIAAKVLLDLISPAVVVGFAIGNLDGSLYKLLSYDRGLLDAGISVRGLQRGRLSDIGRALRQTWPAVGRIPFAVACHLDAILPSTFPSETADVEIQLKRILGHRAERLAELVVHHPIHEFCQSFSMDVQGKYDTDYVTNIFMGLGYLCPMLTVDIPIPKDMGPQWSRYHRAYQDLRLVAGTAWEKIEASIAEEAEAFLNRIRAKDRVELIKELEKQWYGDVRRVLIGRRVLLGAAKVIRSEGARLYWLGFLKEKPIGEYAAGSRGYITYRNSIGLEQMVIKNPLGSDGLWEEERIWYQNIS